MTLQQFINQWNGKKADFDGAYGGQCVDLFRFYNRDVLGISQPRGVVGAADFWANYETDPILNQNFTKIKNTADFIPKKGDVMLWNKRAGGGYGHVAIVCGDDHTLDYFHSFDQNWSRVSYCEVVKHNYTNVYGVLRPISSTGESMPDKTYTEDQMTEVRLERDRNWDLYQKEKQTSEEYRSEAQSRREDYDRLIEDLAKRLNLPVSSDRSDILAAVDRLLKVEEDLRVEQREHKKTYETLNREKDELKAEIDQLRAEIERQQKQNETLLNRIDKLESRIEQHEQIRETTNRFSEWLESVLNLFRR